MIQLNLTPEDVFDLVWCIEVACNEGMACLRPDILRQLGEDPAAAPYDLAARNWESRQRRRAASGEPTPPDRAARD